MTQAIAKRQPNAQDDSALYVNVRADGSFIPADDFSAARLRIQGVKRGERVRVCIKRQLGEEAYRRWRRAHALGTLCALNLDEFEEFQLISGRIDAHGAVKRLQFLSGTECDETIITMPDGTEMLARQARSLAWEVTPPERFEPAYKKMCAYLRKRFWPELEDWQFDEMVRLVE